MAECETVPPLALETDAHAVACWLSDATRRAAGHGSLDAAAGGAR
jgi:hypothetical protein